MSLNRRSSHTGTTLVELMIVVAILGIISMTIPPLLTNVFRMWKTTEARVDVQKDARITLTLIQNLLRHASANSIEITRQSTENPPYSKIRFTVPEKNSNNITINQHTYEFYQLGDELWVYHYDPATPATHHRVLAGNLRYISFAFPQITEDSHLSVAICFEKGTYQGQTKDFYLSSQRVQVMNL